MKISVIMPTYNDSDSIVETLDSLKNQTYNNWELIIIDDGSSDNTKEIVESYIKENSLDKKIQYYYQSNSDQLNAIKQSLKYITGDYVYILHSDDLLYNNTFENFKAFVLKKPEFDAYVGDLTIIDGDSVVTGQKKVLNYKKSDSRLALLYLWLGRNLYVDFAFWKKDVFLEKVKESYLDWNMPYWVDLNDNADCLNVINMNFPMFKYRVYQNNYINNEIGKLNVINGELRTATRLMSYYYIPYYNCQYFVFRIFNKLGLSKNFKPIFLKQEEKNKDKIVKFIIEKRYKKDYKKYVFLNSLIKFYEADKTRTIQIQKIKDNEKIYLGSDVREFNNNLIKGTLSELYYNLFDEMNKGFSTIECAKGDKNKVTDITKFLCIHPYVNIIEK